VLEAIKEFDTPTIFNAVSRVMRDLTPQKWYSNHTIRHLIPTLGSFCGYAVTAEVSTNDDEDHIGFGEYWRVLKEAEGPIVTLLKDIDSDPGRGASTGDGMSRNHKFYGVVGCIVDGTVRDVPGIEKVGLPVMGWGTVPGAQIQTNGRTATTNLADMLAADMTCGVSAGAAQATVRS